MKPRRGVDVSRWQGRPVWSEVFAAGYTFAIVKATEGTGYTDPLFADDVAGALAAGLDVWGVYHFLRAGGPEEQAEHFAATVWGVEPLPRTTRLVVDVEPAPDGAHPSADDVVTFMRCLRRLFPARAGALYSYGAFIQQLRLPAEVATLAALWLADLHAGPPVVPAPWTAQGLVLRQVSGHGHVPGIVGEVDLDGEPPPGVGPGPRGVQAPAPSEGSGASRDRALTAELPGPWPGAGTDPASPFAQAQGGAAAPAAQEDDADALRRALAAEDGDVAIDETPTPATHGAPT